MGEVVKLLPSPVSQDTVDELAALLREARRGKIIGLAYVAVHPGQQFDASTVGQAKDSPIFTLGAIRCLSDHVVNSIPLPPK